MNDDRDRYYDTLFESKQVLSAERRLNQLRRMHPLDPDFDPDEYDELEDFLKENV